MRTSPGPGSTGSASASSSTSGPPVRENWMARGMLKNSVSVDSAMSEDGEIPAHACLSFGIEIGGHHLAGVAFGLGQNAAPGIDDETVAVGAVPAMGM